MSFTQCRLANTMNYVFKKVRVKSICLGNCLEYAKFLYLYRGKSDQVKPSNAEIDYDHE